MSLGRRHGAPRRALAATLLILMSAAILACDRRQPERVYDTRDAALAVPDSIAEHDGHPFAHFSGRSMAGYGRPAAVCLQQQLRMPPQTAGGVIEGTLVLTNHCDLAVAVLTAPVELRQRLRGDQRFVFEAASTGQVYALAYIYRQEHGLDPHSFLGDGGLWVSVLPDYAVVGPRETLELPVTSGIPIDWGPGEYGILFVTIVVPATGSPATSERIDFSESVAFLSFSRERTPQLRTPPGAVRIFCRGSLTLKPAPGPS